MQTNRQTKAHKMHKEPQKKTAPWEPGLRVGSPQHRSLHTTLHSTASYHSPRRIPLNREKSGSGEAKRSQLSRPTASRRVVNEPGSASHRDQ